MKRLLNFLFEVIIYSVISLNLYEIASHWGIVVGIKVIIIYYIFLMAGLNFRIIKLEENINE